MTARACRPGPEAKKEHCFVVFSTVLILSERVPYVALKECIPLNETEGVFDELKECSEIKRIQQYFETAGTKQNKTEKAAFQS